MQLSAPWRTRQPPLGNFLNSLHSFATNEVNYDGDHATN